MAGADCTCGEKFRDAEDFRDHLPCPGSPTEQAYAKGRREREKEILASFERAIAGHEKLALEFPNNVDTFKSVDAIKAEALRRFADVFVRSADVFVRSADVVRSD